jgi:hypothetical protein
MNNELHAKLLACWSTFYLFCICDLLQIEIKLNLCYRCFCFCYFSFICLFVLLNFGLKYQFESKIKNNNIQTNCGIKRLNGNENLRIFLYFIGITFSRKHEQDNVKSF